MAGGHMKYRTLGRSSAHRQALLRNLVTSLIKNERLHTTWPKAKEAQRLAEKLITYAKRDNPETRKKAEAILFTPHELLPKLFGPLKERYQSRPGGYTRVLRTEPKDPDDQAPSAILELVDSPRSIRLAMTAAALARDRARGRKPKGITVANAKKLTRFRPDGAAALEELVQKVGALKLMNAGRGLQNLPTDDWKRGDWFRLRKQAPPQDFWTGGWKDRYANQRSYKGKGDAEVAGLKAAKGRPPPSRPRIMAGGGAEGEKNRLTML